jgi:hypothetical protein
MLAQNQVRPSTKHLPRVCCVPSRLWQDQILRGCGHLEDSGLYPESSGHMGLEWEGGRWL